MVIELKNEKGRTHMDILIMIIVALVLAVITALFAVIRRKKIGKVFLYGITGLIIGLPVGYFIAPTIISFM